jgi:trimethylamine--corrinoid protein Co-methyltransferase
MASMTGMNFIYDAAGSRRGSLVLSKEKVVIDDELCGMVARTLDGIRVDDETLAVEEILKVGPAATFLGRPFTMSHLRSEHFIPNLLERRSREAWEKDGFKDIAARAREKAKRILREHVPEPMEKDIVADLEEYMRRTTKAHGH